MTYGADERRIPQQPSGTRVTATLQNRPKQHRNGGQKSNLAPTPSEAQENKTKEIISSSLNPNDVICFVFSHALEANRQTMSTFEFDGETWQSEKDLKRA